MNVAELSPEAKIQFIADQITDVMNGYQSSIFCPYCGTKNKRSDVKLCCELFAEATSAVLDRHEQEKTIDLVSNVYDRTAN